jgi:hypothetical protein
MLRRRRRNPLIPPVRPFGPHSQAFAGPLGGSMAGLHAGFGDWQALALGAGDASTVSSREGLVGREPELTLAAAAVRQFREGRASALTIEGEAGIGKTCLVRSIVDAACCGDVEVLCGQAHPFEHTRPFGVVAAALDLSRRSPDPRRAAIGALLAGQGAGPSARTAGDIQYRVVEEIVDLVETLCAERPVLLVAEDIHWAEQREPVGDLVGGAAAAAGGVACRGDSPALTAAGRGGPAAR